METILFNAHFNYFFNFIEKAPVHNFADDNSISLFAETPEDLVKSLEQKNKVAINWFPINNKNKKPSPSPKKNRVVTYQGLDQ